MSNRLRGICAAIALPLLLTGCGATSGFLRDSMTQTQIQGSGFRIVTTGLAATVTTGAVFCSIPTGEGEAYRRAMDALNAQAKLRPNQMLVNIREDHKSVAYLFFFCSYELTLSADIIEFLDTESVGALAPPVAPPTPPPPPPAALPPAPAAPAAAPPR